MTEGAEGVSRQDIATVRLLPFERRFAEWGFLRPNQVRNSQADQWLLDYGPRGMVLLVVSLGTLLVTGSICVIGIVLLFVSEPVGRAAIPCGMVATVLPTVRLLQAVRAGKRFRDSRPYER